MHYSCVMFKTLLGFVFVFGLLVSMPVHAQDAGISRKKQEKILEKKAKTEKKEQAKQERQDRKRHLSLQDKATRKRLKRHGKRADRGGSNTHRDGFFRRTFGL